MFHTSMNNFRSYYNGYPFKSNVIDEIQAIGEAADDTIIVAAHDQIEAILTMKPFDPEEFGFEPEKNVSGDEQYVKNNNGLNYMIWRNPGPHYGYWNIAVQQFTGQEDQLLVLYIPNDMAGRIILTALGIVPRRDLDENGKGCPDDDNLDGTCVMCENNGTCLNKK